MEADTRSLESRLATGGKSNSLGEVSNIVVEVLNDPTRLPELFECLFNHDEWIRMRAGDALEKVCREQPGWFAPYRSRLLTDVAEIRQASVQWHLAQMLGEIRLTRAQRQTAIAILSANLADPDVDWIVSANSMKTLALFVRDGSFPVAEFVPLLRTQLEHRSNAVVKRAGNFLNEFDPEDAIPGTR